MITTQNSNLQLLFALDLGYDESDVIAGGPKRDMIRERIQEDFVKADVYFQTLNVQTIRQEEKYSVSMVWRISGKLRKFWILEGSKISLVSLILEQAY